jgi:anti-anti-sigma factor
VPTTTEIKDGLLRVQQNQDETRTHLALEGELDLANAHTLELTLEEALRGGGEVVVDLGRLEFLDSTGIMLLVLALQGPHAEQLTFLPSESPDVRRLLGLTGMDERLGFGRGADRPIPPVV